MGGEVCRGVGNSRAMSGLFCAIERLTRACFIFPRFARGAECFSIRGCGWMVLRF